VPHPPAAAPSPATPAGEPLVAISALEKSYRTGEVETPVLRGVDLTVARGECVAVLGASGCGKTTLLHLVGALDRPDRGSIRIAGAEITRLSRREQARLRRERLGFVFQFYNLLPTLTARENVEVALELLPISRSELRAQAAQALEQVGLGARQDRFPAQLSGGEQQRVAVARALARRPMLLLADEPTGNLDAETGGKVFATMRALTREAGVTLLVASHNLELAHLCDRVVRILGGRVVDVPAGPAGAAPAAEPACGTI
jgi:putative ABC transport system ATP-binding protein